MPKQVGECSQLLLFRIKFSSWAQVIWAFSESPFVSSFLGTRDIV